MMMETISTYQPSLECKTSEVGKTSEVLHLSNLINQLELSFLYFEFLAFSCNGFVFVQFCKIFQVLFNGVHRTTSCAGNVQVIEVYSHPRTAKYYVHGFLHLLQ